MDPGLQPVLGEERRRRRGPDAGGDRLHAERHDGRQAIPLTDTDLALSPGDSLRLSGWGSSPGAAGIPTTRGRRPRSPRRSRSPTASTPLRCAKQRLRRAFRRRPGCCAPARRASTPARATAAARWPSSSAGASGSWRASSAAAAAADGAGGYPGYYARVSSAPIHAFLAARGNGYTVAAPANVSRPVIAGTPAPGGTLGCDIGGWNDATIAFGLRYLVGGQPVVPTDDLTPSPAAMAGQTVVCDVQGYGLVGEAEATSAPVTIAGGAAPIPAPPVTPVAPPSSPTPTPAAADTKAPKAKKRSACTRTICRLDVTATRPGAQRRHQVDRRHGHHHLQDDLRPPPPALHAHRAPEAQGHVRRPGASPA